MPLTSLLPWILAAIVASIAAMVTGIVSDFPALSWLAAGLFGVSLVATSIDINRPWWEPGAADDPAAPFAAAIRNARLLVIGYLWGSFALFCIYRLTGLRWQHGIQYGAGMAVLAWLILLYVHLLAKRDSKLREPWALKLATLVSLAHGAGALAGVFFLVGSGKVFSIKDDWAANQVFLAGGLAITAMSLISAFTQVRLERRRRDGTERAAGV
ncbi:unnamed protein product [Phaeothamnion confervicola]